MVEWGAVRAAADPAEEVLVVGQRLEDARADLSRELRDRGYVRLVRIGQRSYYVTPQVWKPWVMVHAEGFARYHGVRVYPVGARTDAAGPAQAAFATQSARQTRSQKDRLADAVEPYLARVRDAEWELARIQRELDLATALQHVWYDGLTPDAAYLADPAARRAAIVELWLHTEPDEDGRRTRRLVEDFVDRVVQTSEAPYTADEIAAASARCGFDDRFEPVPPR